MGIAEDVSKFLRNNENGEVYVTLDRSQRTGVRLFGNV